MASIRSIVRWPGGFVALGAEVATGETWRTPAWTSHDGLTWQPVAVDVFGPVTILLGVGETAGGLVALTLQDDSNQCGESPLDFTCSTLAGPLQSWTSPDGVTWTAHPGPPDMALTEVGCDSCGVSRPSFIAGVPGLLAFDGSAASTKASGASFSKDGIAWQALPVGTFPAHFQASDIEAIGTGFIAVGDNGADLPYAMALTSTDGRHWVAHIIAPSSAYPGTGTYAGEVAIGPGGIIATGGYAGAGGPPLWWRSLSGRTWRALTDFSPLGTAKGSDLCEAGCAGYPNGTLVADGQRMLAIRSCTKSIGWSSSDGRTWRTLSFSGSRPTREGALVLLPIGLLCVSEDGSAWFGKPVTS